MYEGMIITAIVCILGSALIIRACRPGPHRWPTARSWFDLR